MGVLVKEEGGKLWLRINHNGQRRSKLVGPDSKATRVEAEKAAAIIRGKLAADDLSPLAAAEAVKGPAGSPTVRAFAAEWLDHMAKHFPRRPSTTENYQSFIDARLIPALGDRRISSITRQVLQDFIAEMRKDVAFLTLRSHYLPVFRKVLDFAVERGHLVANPFRVGGPLFEASDADREAAPRPDPFTPKELDAIVGAAEQIEPEFGLMIRTWSETGARSGEVRGLQVRDLDVKAGTLRIERTLLDGKAITGPPKNLRGRRTVTLDKTQPALVRLAKHCHGKDPEAFIFEKPSGGPVTSGSLKERWRRALDLAGVGYREPEQMRHSYISNAMSRGENALRIANTTGHTVAVLLAHYAAWIPQDAPAASGRTPRASSRRKAS